MGSSDAASKPGFDKSAWLVLALLASGILTYFYRQWIQHCRVPGPWMAAFSNLPRLLWANSGRAHLIHMRLHEKYGRLVRLGPNSISVGDPQELTKIYGAGSNFGKSDFYKVLQPMSKGRVMQGIFNTQDTLLHRQMKKPIASMYSMSTLVEFEPYVDTTIDFLLRRLEQVPSQTSEPCDLGMWLQWFAFDVMGEITFSKRLGFLDRAEDVDSIMADIFSMFRYTAWAGQIPWIERLWAKNTWVRALLPEETSPVVAFALARARERTSIESDDRAVLSDYNSKDFMSRFLAVQRKDPSIPDWFITAWTTSNMLAGSDTTAILLRAIICFLVENPASMKKLVEELDRARQEGRLSELVTWKESRDLPYLDACVKEAQRLYSAIGFCLERVVPQGGAQICGQHFAEGTVVGMNPWVIHRDKDVFGPDADEWNPERWLTGGEAQRRRMQNCLLTFGGGSRTCLGKNISYLEIYKLVPTLISKFEMELPRGLGPWKVKNYWLAVQTEFKVCLRLRS